MVDRVLKSQLKQAAQQIPILTLTGPRQSGKTTLVKNLFSDHTYVNLELPDDRRLATEDPLSFFQQYPQKLILDEVQHVPSIFSYIQSIVDSNTRNGHFILTGSQNFLLAEQISQSLAGRTQILTLLPLSLAELESTPYKCDHFLNYILQGFYPRLYGHSVKASAWLPSYIQTYVERDVRQMMNIRNLTRFQNFLKLCAGHVGQLINYATFANIIGVHETTIREWFSILEASYIIFMLKPYYNNFKKRLLKTPKLYFYDTGLACSLLGVANTKVLQIHPLLGGLFENLIIAELLKKQINQGAVPRLYFWREGNGVEVDCLLEQGTQVIPIEIKTAQTIKSFSVRGFKRLQKVMGRTLAAPYVVYGGQQHFTQNDVQVVSWQELDTIAVY